MLSIVEKQINIVFPRGHHQHVLLCQIPNHLQRDGDSYRIADTQKQWQQIRSILDLVNTAEGTLSKAHFLLFPEALLPLTHLDDALATIKNDFRNNSILVCGLEPMPLTEFHQLLKRFSQDNIEVRISVEQALADDGMLHVPVNSCLTAVKEDTGRLRVFFEAKSHPFVGEENIDYTRTLYRGKVFPLFRCQPGCFNFMNLICLDYAYRDLTQSNISMVIDYANELYLQSRQQLDLLNVIECNPKPEHQAFRDVVNGFYGEYLAYTPGVENTVTIFCNSSGDSWAEGIDVDPGYGHSAVLMSHRHKLLPSQAHEYTTDDFGGLPVCRLRFSRNTRLYYFNLPLFHELDPRTTRVPMKIHAIFCPNQNGGWQRCTTEMPPFDCDEETAKN